jgi:hypothetical protein
MVFLIILPIAFGVLHHEFFYTVGKELDQGAKWHYVGRQPVDPNAKSLPMQWTVNGNNIGEPFIAWKLKK